MHAAAGPRSALDAGKMKTRTKTDKVKKNDRDKNTDRT